MSQPPTPYARIFDFEAFSTNNPATQQPGVQFEGEFDAIKLTLDSLILRLAQIQRDDGQLRASAFDNTDIIENIQTTSYTAVYSLLFPLVGQAATHADSASASATASQTSSTQAAAYVAQALHHKNDAAASATLAASQALQAQQALGQVNVAAGSAQSAAYEAEQSKIATLIASNAAEGSLGTVQQLQQTLANKYDNMLDGDQNLADVSSKSNSVTNLGLNAEDQSDRAVYNRLRSMLGMYVIPDSGNWSYQSPLSIDGFLQQNFGLVFNHQTGLFQNASGYWGTFFGRGIEISAGNPEESTIGSGNTPTSQLAWRVSVLKLRLSVLASIFRTTFKEISRYYGYNGDNRIVMLQDFANGNINSLLKANIWNLVAQKVNDAVALWWQTTDAPSNGKQYARRNNAWQEISQSGGVSQYDNFKVYNANDVVWLGNFIYRFNAFIGAAGYGPVTHPANWTKLSASEISDINGLQTALNGKASSTHTHSIANVTGLQTALNNKADNFHNHDVLSLANSDKLQRSRLPVINQNYQQQLTVYSPGYLYVLDYASDTNGKVTFGNPWYNFGERYFFYQSGNANYPIHFANAINIDGKTFTRGARSYVEAVCTPDGWLVSGDLIFPPSGTLLSSSCEYVENFADAQGVSWSGNFFRSEVYADGNGGTYVNGGYNQNGCWYPYGFCLQNGVTLSTSTLSWSGCSSSGTYTYSVGYGHVRADGNGGTYHDYTGGWSANSGDIIYDSGNSCVVRYDGSGGYYVEDTSGSGSGYPSYGTYLGYFSGTYQLTYTSSWGNNYSFDYASWAEDRYADGGGSYYLMNNNFSYYSYGTYLGYISEDGVYVFADGNGSYYTQYYM